MDDGRKKYAPKLCAVDPFTLGTVCEDPGQKCKTYPCSGNIPNRPIGQTLSSLEVDKYAQNDANLLLSRGLIDPENVSYFKNLIVSGLKIQKKNR